MRKVYIIQYVIKRLNEDGKTYQEISKISQEGYSSLKKVQDFCIYQRGAKEINPFWYIVPSSVGRKEIKEYQIYEIEVK